MARDDEVLAHVLATGGTEAAAELGVGQELASPEGGAEAPD